MIEGGEARLHADDRIAETPATKHRDYILMSYEPRCPPAGRLQAQSLFRASLRQTGWLEAVWPLCERLQATLGPDETVWGIKWGPGGPSVEFYFYNFVANGPDNPASAAAVTAALAAQVAFPHPVDEAIPYFMCSFEVTAEAIADGRAEAWRIYTRTGDEHRREAGFSWRVEERPVLENHYWFYFARKADELADVVHRLANSFRAGDRRSQARLLPPQLRDCHTLCYAAKPHSDALYYSRISTEQLGWFFEHRFPHPLGALVRAHSDELAHLSWDVGVDFRSDRPGGTVTIDKVGLYGVL